MLILRCRLPGGTAPSSTRRRRLRRSSCLVGGARDEGRVSALCDCGEVARSGADGHVDGLDVRAKVDAGHPGVCSTQPSARWDTGCPSLSVSTRRAVPASTIPSAALGGDTNRSCHDPGRVPPTLSHTNGPPGSATNSAMRAGHGGLFPSVGHKVASQQGRELGEPSPQQESCAMPARPAAAAHDVAVRRARSHVQVGRCRSRSLPHDGDHRPVRRRSWSSGASPRPSTALCHAGEPSPNRSDPPSCRFGGTHRS